MVLHAFRCGAESARCLRIIAFASTLLTAAAAYRRMIVANNPRDDGLESGCIIMAFLDFLQG